MCMKPMELNIIRNITGEGIYLYDTTIPEPENRLDKTDRYRFLEYGYGVLNGRDLLKWALERMKQKYIR